MEGWLSSIGIRTLLKLAPHGLFMGCGATAEYIAYAMRTKPPTESALFAINRSGSYIDSAIDVREFRPSELEMVLSLIEQRLQQHEYVCVSFYDGEVLEPSISSPSTSNPNNGIVASIQNLIMNRPPPRLFDHSFVLVKAGGILRFESYIDQYSPRCVPWNSYAEDLRELFKDPINKWPQLFGVTCLSQYDLTKVRIVICR